MTNRWHSPTLQAGQTESIRTLWIPAFAGMTKRMPAETAAERGESPSEAAGLRGPRRETTKVAPGAAEETEGFRGPRSKTGGKAKRSRKGLRSCEGRQARSRRRSVPAPGAAEETEGFRGPRSKTGGEAKRSRGACGAMRETRRGRIVGIKKPQVHEFCAAKQAIGTWLFAVGSEVCRLVKK